MFRENHWNRGAIKYLDTLMEGMVDYQRLGDLKFEEICWNWSCCRFTWEFTKNFWDSTSYRAGGLFRVLGSRCWTVMYQRGLVCI